jgi:hypothetical protein
MKKCDNIGYVIVISARSSFYLRFRKFIVYKDTYEDKPLFRILNMHGHSCGFIMTGTIPYKELYSQYSNYFVKFGIEAKHFDVSDIEIYENEKIYVMKIYTIET